MPPISEYKIINAPEFSPDNDCLYIIIFFFDKNLLPSLDKPSLDFCIFSKHHTSLNHIYSDQHQVIGKTAHRQRLDIKIRCRWFIKILCIVKYPYYHDYLLSNHLHNPLICRVNSYHIHLNNLEFYRSGREISLKCPYSAQPINTPFPRTHLLPRYSPSPKPILSCRDLVKQEQIFNQQEVPSAEPSSPRLHLCFA